MEANVDPLFRGPDWKPITPKRGSFLHADSQRIIRRVGPRAKRLRAADEDGAAKGHVRHFEFAIS